MHDSRNDLGQTIGAPLDDWCAPPGPPRERRVGRFCTLAPLDVERHARELYEANLEDREGRLWTYLAYGPFATFADYREWMEANCLGEDPCFYALIDNENGKARGLASYLRIDPRSGSIEVGHVNFAPALQKTRAATEAMYLLMRQVFELGYRRYEWKCDACNAASMRAAERLGFQREGVFRQATHYKGRNRDTAWFSVIDSEWPALRLAFEAWLEPSNFEGDGAQRRSLADLTRREGRG